MEQEFDFMQYQLLLCNYTSNQIHNKSITLQPYETLVFEKIKANPNATLIK